MYQIQKFVCLSGEKKRIENNGMYLKFTAAVLISTLELYTKLYLNECLFILY